MWTEKLNIRVEFEYTYTYVCVCVCVCVCVKLNISVPLKIYFNRPFFFIKRLFHQMGTKFDGASTLHWGNTIYLKLDI